ncbi:ribosome recycling factor [Candidatus Synchoanobacter obligatus]|uniref:Ribosome-recycling factor n=1 Tax=Candidatus Synchoanobacter obligatus TaxID=2919597 RepID=A0ABT1L6M6_9GAMM|nr:ribosome recycling factor [Candidatus Synchoanobacter obligatus]MCP8352093.1 ribosome recycling factor [Candidatus Synchoanobacter obligatus]
MIDEMKNTMQNSIDAYKNELSSLRTGRAHSGLLDKVTVDYYGSQTPLNQMANVSVSDARMLMVTPWDKQAVPLIIKAIQVSDLGLNAVAAGDAVRVPIPDLTEERRKQLVKHLKSEAENAKIGLRNVRRNTLSEAKNQVKDKLLSEDDERRIGAEVQKVMDQMVAEIDRLTNEKEKELMTV